MNIAEIHRLTPHAHPFTTADHKIYVPGPYTS